LPCPLLSSGGTISVVGGAFSMEGETMMLTTENGHTYDLDAPAIRGLQCARNASEAEDVFNKWAPHVAANDRCGIWFAVDDVA
jgi:hypothetical protein